MGTEFGRLLREPHFVAAMVKQGVIPSPGTPEEFASFAQEDRKTAQSLINLAKTPVEDYKPSK
ncbi:MAG: hypothetical protein FJX29_00930 [Alphaproteobacteria bacterium]|nr:hypothetical protein [Alphaproteobacteria bacterium]